MSIASDRFEYEIVSMVNSHRGEYLPSRLPRWLLEEGVRPGARIIRAEGIGSLDRHNKTDVIVYLEHSKPIKISAKLLNADFFGNWYGHNRFLAEFGEPAFYRMTAASTAFANDWARTAVAPFVGVSICFGRRGGRTGQKFTDIFTPEDILTIARGYGDGIASANCMFISNTIPRTITGLIDCIEAITIASVNNATEGFMVAHRPINPMTEGTNRGKNVYTRFLPYSRLSQKTIITNPKVLFQLGEFVEVEPTCLNHNHILNDLEEHYNIVIPRKGR